MSNMLWSFTVDDSCKNGQNKNILIRKRRRLYMKSTGIVRHIDNLGRITLPIELRKTLDMACGDPLEIYTEGNSVILRKHESSCVFCGNNRKVTIYKDKCICDNCRRELAL